MTFEEKIETLERKLKVAGNTDVTIYDATRIVRQLFEESRTQVTVKTAEGDVNLIFEDLQQAMERISSANLETLRRWTRMLEQRSERAVTA